MDPPLAPARPRADWHAVLLHAPTPMLMLRGTTLEIEWVNPAWVAMIGRPLAAGGAGADAFPESFRPRVAAVLDSVVRERQAAEVREVPLGGRFFDFSFHLTGAADDEPTGVAVFGLEVTAQVEARQREDASRRLIAALERSNEDLDQFAYITSHDLKAPLRGISNIAQWLEEDLAGALTDDSKHQLDLLRRRARRMDNLIDGLLQYSRAGRRRESPCSVDVGTLLRETITDLAVPPTVRIDVAPDLPTLWSERAPLQQVFAHLIQNAVKHARKPDVRVQVTAEDDRDHWHFTVADDGPGIAPEFHDRVWRIFQTLESRDKVEGTGIGLSIVQRVVQTRGGRAWLESAPGQGARFHFTWPKREVSPW